MSSKKGESKPHPNIPPLSEIQKEIEKELKARAVLEKELDGQEYLIVDSKTVLVIEKREEFADGSVLDYSPLEVSKENLNKISRFHLQ